MFAAMRALGRQRLVRFGVTRLLWTLCPPGRRDHPFEVDVFGLRYRGNLRYLIDWWVFFFGCYECEMLALLRRLAEERRRSAGRVTYVDVGANVGQHAAFMSLYADRVVAFEPLPDYRAQLQALLDANGLAERVTVEPCGLGAEAGEVPFVVDSSPNRTGHFAAQAGGDLPSLPVETGDGALARLDVPRIDIVKVDTDGFERDVLLGLRERLQRDRPALLLENSFVTAEPRPGPADLRALLYEDATVYEVRPSRLWWHVTLAPVEVLPETREILVLPAEWPLTSTRVRGARA